MSGQTSLWGSPRCSKCRRPIEWITTGAGKAMPVDPGAVTVVTKGGETVVGYVPHWSTCPHADSFRGPR